MEGVFRESGVAGAGESSKSVKVGSPARCWEGEEESLCLLGRGGILRASGCRMDGRSEEGRKEQQCGEDEWQHHK